MPAAAKDTKKDTKTATKPAATSTKKAAVQRLAIGLRGLRGHAVTKRQKKVANPHRKNQAGRRLKLIREVIRDVSGYAPYERRIMELLRNGLEKRALKLAKKKLGGHQRAKRKWAELQEAIRKIREQKAKETETKA